MGGRRKSLPHSGWRCRKSRQKTFVKAILTNTIQRISSNGSSPATSGEDPPEKHADVLQHAAGHLRGFLDSESKREIQDCIQRYRSGLVPLVVPFTLIRHYARLFDITYLAGQVYFNPYPQEFLLLMQEAGYPFSRSNLF